MSAPPKTVLVASPEEARAIREAVRRVDVATLGPGHVLATRDHVAGVVELLADPAVSDPIYSLPRPITEASIGAWIADSEDQRRAGDGLLVLTCDATGAVVGYSKITVWPERASAELGGALRADRQGSGSGGAGAAHTLGWMFATLGVRLVCLTAAEDNVRSARLIERMGFVRMGERDGVRGDGSIRRSRYWELTREAWAQRNGLNV